MFSNHERSFCYALWSKGPFGYLTAQRFIVIPSCYLGISLVDVHVYAVCVQCVWVNLCVRGLEIPGLHNQRLTMTLRYHFIQSLSLDQTIPTII